ncbi:DNA polymerase alpha subunit B-like [Saccoglossus kowalevskii]|uniref:DNA polymerase alpha subunit B n=1 Tax=Saccoglossus kowalevskii TaxID=10224 RepID=A0ABM0GJS9_SACKO|nr:PREDICTED: DNA polymerase alpha subunit B-like [Saccoglossus kowalevskii]
MCAAVSGEDLSEDFATFDIELTDPDVVDKLKELCMLHRLESSSLVDEWVAFSHTHQNINMTMDTIELFERERLNKKSHKNKTPVFKRERNKHAYDINTIDQLIDNDEANDLLNAYCTPSTKGKNKRLHTTPENIQNKRLTGLSGSPAMAPFSPKSLSSPIGTPSQKYSSRNNQGNVVATFGNTRIAWRGSGADNISIDHYDKENALTTNIKYMFQKYADKANVLNDMIEDLGYELQNGYVIENLGHVALPLQESFTAAGRICCDSNGKLNSQSVILEGSSETSAGKHVSLLLNIKEYSLFPGQIVAVDGTNSTGSKLVVSKLYPGLMLPFNQIEDKESSTGPLYTLTTAGPYFTSDSLSFDPLNDLIKVILKEKPDVCILFGPFVDSRHEHVVNGLEGTDMTYEELFSKMIVYLTEKTSQSSTHLIIVPSQRDIHHEYVYPQPPYTVHDLPKQEFNRVHFVSDPCTLSINGVIFGITATDILFHLGGEEISWPVTGSDRLARLCKHILTQHNYYPLYPPADEVNIDYEYFDHYAKMQVTPDVLILPSDLRFFIKDVSGCVCINPGRLTKGQIGGTYGRLLIKPKVANNGVVQQTAAEIIKL